MTPRADTGTDAKASAQPSVCHVFMSKLANESRLEKEIGFLRTHGFDGPVQVLGVADADVVVSPTLHQMAQVRLFSPEAPLRRIPIVGKLLRFRRWATQVRAALRQRDNTIVVAHSLPAFVVCSALNKLSGRLIYDAHEYETERNGFRPWQKRLARLAEGLCIGKASEVWAVSPSIVDAYRTRYPHVPARLIMNLPPRPLPDVTDPDIRARLNIPPDRLVCGYLGALGPGRCIELYLDTFAKLWESRTADRNTVPDLVIVGDGVLRSRCEQAAAKFPNIHYLPPVPPDQVVAAARHFDIGLCLIDPSSLSYKYSLPNKFFQHLSAGNFTIVLDASTDMLRFAPDDNRILTTQADTLSQAIGAATQAHARNAATSFASDKSYFWEDQTPQLHAAFADLPLNPAQAPA
ncbi:glycosyltransferase [Sulfitobacter pacificus]|uniref:glycosyltransferase n=1 Tax=Sulfitobacter pacificus TaxID=1499314 RepID=UPI003103B041